VSKPPSALVPPNLLRALLEFRSARNWEQFHTPKNLASAISVEAAELLEHFIWEIGSERSDAVDRHRRRIEEEVADLIILLSYLVHDLSIDVNTAVSAKLAANAQKYPTDTFHGSNRKYSDL
jgi:NTP pyrophosphatase (non-canonical NTP hydrolase)